MFEVGLSREIITPARGIPLAGYFNPRPNTGIMDDLFVRVALFHDGTAVTGLAVFDLCFLSTDLIDNIKARMVEAGLGFGENILFSATHTHTGPYVDDFFGVSADEAYLEYITEKTVSAIKMALANMAEAEMFAGSVDCNPLAFNRRYWMKNGSVLTNPGKLNPDIVKPEGPVDTGIGIVKVVQDGRVSAVFTNIVNHTDTIGGDFVSADWPGRMEKEIQNKLGYDMPVFTLIGCSGNINHFDVSSGADQSSYAEACRIGKGYAEIVTVQLESLKKLEFANISAVSTDMAIPFRNISDEEVARAEAIIERVGDVSSDEDMTSEGLATGDGPVAKFFAEQLVAYKKSCSGRERKFTIISLRFGTALAMVSLPGEPFTEIGLKIKAESPFGITLPVTLGMGECGYIPLEGCFSRGGYEILPVEGGGPREDTASRISEVCTANLNS